MIFPKSIATIIYGCVPGIDLLNYRHYIGLNGLSSCLTNLDVEGFSSYAPEAYAELESVADIQNHPVKISGFSFDFAQDHEPVEWPPTRE